MNGNYGWTLPIQASTYAKDIDFGIYVIHVAMILIFILWGIFFAYLLVRYRRREGVPAKGGHEDKESLLGLLPDLAVVVFEVSLIVFYAIPAWTKIKMSTPDRAASLNVHIIAEQFAWNVVYPGPDGKFGRRAPELVHFTNPVGLDRSDAAGKDDIVLANELHMPLGKATVIDLSSKDVIHSFFVPEFRIKQDAVPGMRIPVWVEPTLAGKFEIGCAQLCGFGHALMRGDVVVHADQAAFDAFLKSRSATAQAKAPQPVEQW